MSANKRRAPTIPDKNRSFGYHLTSKGDFKPIKNPLKEYREVKSMLALERSLNNNSRISSTSKSQRQKCASAWAKSKIKRTISLASEPFERDEYKAAIFKEKTKHYITHYVKPMKAKLKNQTNTRAFKKEGKKPSYPLPSGIVRASVKKYMDNLQEIINQQPGPGAYYDEKKHSSFTTKSKRVRNHKDVFSLQPERFEDNPFKQSMSPGPGAYNQNQNDDVGFNKYKLRKGKEVPFNSNAPRLKEPRKNEFGEIDQDYILPGPGHSANFDEDPRMIMAELRKKNQLQQKSEHIRKTQREKDLAFGPFRKKLRRERTKVPDPGLYFKSKSVEKKAGAGVNFKSKTSKLTVFEQKKGQIPPPGYYKQDSNTIAQHLVHPALKVNKEVDVCFNSHAPRFDYNKKPNLYSQLKKVKQALTDEEKMLKVVQNLYKAGLTGQKFTGKEGVYYTNPFEEFNLGTRAGINQGLGGQGKSWTFNKSVSILIDLFLS